MSTCALMLVKDEADIIGFVVPYLLGQVDQVHVLDNVSTDGTFEILDAIRADVGDRLLIEADEEVGYYQAEKTTRLAAAALARGHRWAIPCDADELWYATDGRRLADFLAGLAPDVAYVQADLYNHLPSALDRPAERICPRCSGSSEVGILPAANCPVCRGQGSEPNPLRRIGWRQREHGALGKVACRLRPGLEIRQGNHSAYAPGGGVTAGGLVVRHFSWRSEAQYLRKIRNGEHAYAATTLDPSTGAHWRGWAGAPDEAVLEHFRTWFVMDDPLADGSLIYDPAPGA